MKVQVRQGVFETNSSSTHAISVCTKSQWEDYKSGKLWLNRNLDFLPVAEAEEYNNNVLTNAKERCEQRGWKFDRSDYEDELYHSYDDEYEDYNYEWFSNHFKLDNGCDVVAFGYYGSDY